MDLAAVAEAGVQRAAGGVARGQEVALAADGQDALLAVHHRQGQGVDDVAATGRLDRRHHLAAVAEAGVQRAVGEHADECEVLSRRVDAGLRFAGGNDLAVVLDRHREGAVALDADRHDQDAALGKTRVERAVGAVAQQQEVLAARRLRGVAGDDDAAVGLHGQRGGDVAVGADLRDHLAGDAEAGVDGAVTLVAHQRDEGAGVGGGGAGDDDLAVGLHGHGVGVVLAGADRRRDGAAAKAGVDHARQAAHGDGQRFLGQQCAGAHAHGAGRRQRMRRPRLGTDRHVDAGGVGGDGHQRRRDAGRQAAQRDLHRALEAAQPCQVHAHRRAAALQDHGLVAGQRGLEARRQRRDEVGQLAHVLRRGAEGAAHHVDAVQDVAGAGGHHHAEVGVGLRVVAVGKGFVRGRRLVARKVARELPFAEVHQLARGLVGGDDAAAGHGQRLGARAGGLLGHHRGRGAGRGLVATAAAGAHQQRRGGGQGPGRNRCLHRCHSRVLGCRAL